MLGFDPLVLDRPLALVVMLRLSWQVTVLARLLLPVFVLPARRMGARLAHLEREAADVDRPGVIVHGEDPELIV